MTTHHRLTAEGLTLGYGDRTVVDSLDLAVPPGRITVIVGANACGKSTLLRSMSRLLAPRKGRVVLDGKEVHRLPAKELARTLGLLPQSPVAPEGITVSDLVGRGRHPHQSVFSRWNEKDDAAVAAAWRPPTPNRSPNARWTNSPADSASACGSRWPSPSRPTCCCSTSPPPSSTPATRSRSSTSSPI